MICHSRSRRAFTAALLGCVCLLAGVCASAMDVNDVKNMVRSRVAEEVIINMVRQSTPIAMSDADANELRSLGASENLVGIVRDSYTGGPVYAENPGEYIMSDGSTAPIYSPGATSGTVTYVDPSSGVVYADPNVYYTTPPTVVYEAPTVVTPTYVYPSYPYYGSGSSWGFSIGFGGSDRRYRDGHRGGGHRGGPPPRRHR